MGQLVIKKVSWWESHAKQLVIWGPIAAVQASTLAGLGYFYQRLNVLEANDVLPPAPSVLSSSLQDVKPLRVVRTSRIPLPPPPAPAPVARVPVALNNNTAVIDFARVGQDFSAVAVKRPAVVTQKTLLTSKTAVKKVKAVKAIKANDDERVAQANRSEILRKQESSDASFQLAPSFQEDVVAANAVVIPDDVPRGQPLPVGIITWVYLGELREQGWHGQRLHIASHSGLPVIGEQYRTQKIHGIYDQPYGTRTMGGFQKGDLVEILDVRHEANFGVWAEVRKVRSVGKPGCVTCTQ
ncbi:hypothetical protein HMY34_03740 [Thiothrix subterranea]|uniref:hypothetical protein n=1 Tax=Thiothrix subterranea TaxID=2735563 RepID=UPI00192B0549|nr:hypothetical protein [Thiothrix subterranea]QQZ27936.1 hypothetical protein HMY34_03740 [Thiothrix subterranea]